MTTSFRVVVILLTALAFFATETLADLPRSTSIATHSVGTLFNATGTGIATVLSRHTPMSIRVQPFAGPPAWFPSMDGGETDMGISTSGDAATGYKGVTIYKRPYKNIRILTVGAPLRVSFYVLKDSPIEHVTDLKGKRLPTEFPGIPVVRLSSSAGLASAGLSYDDIVRVPVSDLQASAQAFLEGRIDAGWHSVGSPAIEEANARKGVKFISVNSTAEGAKRMAAVYPGSYPSALKGGSATGVLKDTVFVTNDIYLMGAKALSDEAAYEVVKVLWQFYEELPRAYPALKAWTRERMVSENAVIPYHSGAIKFFREKGVWSAKMEALQASLLGQ